MHLRDTMKKGCTRKVHIRFYIEKFLVRIKTKGAREEYSNKRDITKVSCDDSRTNSNILSQRPKIYLTKKGFPFTNEYL